MAEVYIEGKRLDVFEKLNFSFNYSIADIRDPKKRSTSYSKTVRCPGTQNNDEIFGQIYDLNISNAFDSTSANIEVNFNPNKKAKALVIADGVLVMEGSFQLRKIVRHNTELIYEAVFLGQLVNIFGILSDKMINGYEWDEATETNVKYIDFSDLDHYYKQANQTTSWTAPYGEGYVYPMIDYGKTTEYHGVDLWRKYKVTDLKPALYAKEILDRIFDFAGFTYQSTFFESAFFKRLIIPCRTQSSEESTSERLFLAQAKDQLLNNRRYPGYGLVNHTIGNDSRMGESKSWALICFDNDSSAPAFDNGTLVNFGNFWVNPTPFPAPPQSSDGWGSLDSGSYSWRVNEQTAGTYNLRSKVTVNFNEWAGSYNDWDDFVDEIDMLYGLTQGESMNGKVQFWRRRANGNPPPTWEVTKLAETDISFPLHNVGMGTVVGYQGEVTVDLVAEEVEVYDGDAIFMVIDFQQSTDGTNATGYSPAMDFSIMGSGIWYTLLMTTTATFYNEHISGAELVDSEWLEFNNNLPEISMADYLLSLINMFNLYVWPNPNKENELIIETRDDFYEGGEVKDWSHKLDYSKRVELNPLAMLTAREYIYTYSEDDDYYNERYQDSHGHPYGRSRVEVDNDFITNTDEVEVSFSPSPLVNDNPSNRLVTKIYDSDIAEGTQPTDHNVRILYYGGMLDSNPKWVHTSLFDGWNYPLQYPYAGHLTHPLAPAQDINFGIPFELYYSANQYTGTLLYTNDNLFNRYHRRGLLEATNKDSKLMVAYFVLSPLDIQKLDFRDQILIDNSYWRINKVMNYNPFDNSLTKVELIKVITKEPLKAETFGVGSGGTTGGGSTGGTIEKRPRIRKSLRDGNRAPIMGGMVKGFDNHVEDGVTNFMVQGRNNHVKKGSTDVTIIGNDNIVEEGLTSVRLINTNGATITRSNVTLINNREQSSSAVIEGGENEVRALDGGTNIFTLDGGEDIVQAQFSETSIYLIEGNGNSGLTN